MRADRLDNSYEWEEVTLGDVLTLQRGFDLPTRSRELGPHPVVSSSGVTGFHSEYKVEPPGVVIGRYGSLGSVHWVTTPFWPLNTSLWVKDFKGNDERFVSYLLQTVTVDGSTASAVPGVNRNHLHKLPVQLPGLPTQRRVAAVLSAFDELIEINERRIALLEELARSLYRAWFVDFRFPGHGDVELVDSELGPIPEGWTVARFDELAGVVVDGVNPSELEPDSPYVGLEHVPRRRTTLREWTSPESITSRKLLFSTGDTLFGKIRPYFHKVAWAPFAGSASSDTIVIRAHPDQGLAAFVNAVASTDEFVAEAVATSNGTKMPRADPKALLAYKFPLGGQRVLIEFERIVRRWLEWSAELVQQTRQLAATRDLLLPRLVTGRLDIADVDLGILTPPEVE